MIKVKIYKIKNINEMLYAIFEIISPKNIKYYDLSIDINRINKYTKNNFVCIGSQWKENRDSLYTPENTEKSWEKGHIGHITKTGYIEEILTQEEKEKIYSKYLKICKIHNKEYNSSFGICPICYEELLFKMTSEL